MFKKLFFFYFILCLFPINAQAFRTHADFVKITRKPNDCPMQNCRDFIGECRTDFIAEGIYLENAHPKRHIEVEVAQKEYMKDPQYSLHIIPPNTKKKIMCNGIFSKEFNIISTTYTKMTR